MSSSDSREWAKFSVTFASNMKVAGLSDGAFRTLVEMILWSRQELTDGIVPAVLAHKFWNADALQELCTNHRERPSLTMTEEGDYLLHDFVKHQGTRADIEAAKERKSAAARKRWAKTKPSKDAGINASAMHLHSDSNAGVEQDQSIRERKRESVPIGTDLLGGANALADEKSELAKAKRKRGTRLPEDWAPSEDLVDWTRNQAPAAANNAEVEKFRDYWHAKAGSSAVKVDWDATWRNWARKRQEEATSRGGYRNQAQIMADVHAQAHAATQAMGGGR